MPIHISFCTTCRNRLWQLKETLPKNLETIHANHEIILVDYGSTDNLKDWIWSNFRAYIESGKLTFFEVTNSVHWNVARAKNLAHRLASGNYFFNLDADNFVTNNDLQLISKARGLELSCHQWSGNFDDGSFGRIGITSRIFETIGGYDETLLPMGGQDIDILNRIRHLNHKIIKIPPTELDAIKNNKMDKVREIVSTIPSDFEAEKMYGIMNSLSLTTSKFKLSSEGPVRLGGGFSYKGNLNGKKITINGFNEIQFE